MKRHIFHAGQGQERMTGEPNCAMPDEAGAVTMIARQMRAFGRFAQPESVVARGAGAGQPTVVQDCSEESVVAFREDEDAAPGLGSAQFGESKEFPAPETCVQELAGSGYTAARMQVFEDVHVAIGRFRLDKWNLSSGVCG
ncbi:hypothetical protein [Pseudarthrobacter sp. NIBRBAC000502770]|uniref:hypothetical protein n=1 Tax=Pseudarthrobacter sp. NIBRBAC000502770 TaxID=2590785 RepID=UPI001FEFBC56|nr:hypothetical protein [Pseudarthrobacter sp. NIBRBAC000502770]